jgi:hypothetical protein
MLGFAWMYFHLHLSCLSLLVFEAQLLSLYQDRWREASAKHTKDMHSNLLPEDVDCCMQLLVSPKQTNSRGRCKLCAIPACLNHCFHPNRSRL